MHSGLWIVRKTREDHAEPSVRAKKAIRRNARRKHGPREFAQAIGLLPSP